MQVMGPIWRGKAALQDQEEAMGGRESGETGREEARTRV